MGVEPPQSGPACISALARAGSTVLTALVEDTPCIVGCLDPAGRVLYANHNAAILFDRPDGGMTGTTLFDLLPPDVASERLILMRQAVEDGKPRAIIGMVRGCRLRTVYRPVQCDVHGPCVLVTSALDRDLRRARDATFALDAAPARFHDWGVLDPLTQRELEILKFIGEGLTADQIAKRLHRSRRTIQWHRVSIGRKLDGRNRVGLAELAQRAGLCHISLEQLRTMKQARDER